MNITINNLNINYIDEGQGQDIIILHGWGSSIKLMQNMFNHLIINNRVVLLDLPGFGESDGLKSSWTLKDYTEFVIQFMKEVKIKNPIVIGHSFGGRIAIKLASEYPKIKLNKIILIDSAGIKKETKKSLKTKTLKLLGKTVGKISPKLVEKAKNKIGSVDYRNASPIMKETLVNVVNEDLTNNLPKIYYSTLLIWGENDQETPIDDANLMHNKILDSGIVMVPKASHFSFLDNPILVHKVIDSFIGKGDTK